MQIQRYWILKTSDIGLEDDMKLFKTLMIKGKDNEKSVKRLSIAEGTV